MKYLFLEMLLVSFGISLKTSVMWSNVQVVIGEYRGGIYGNFVLYLQFFSINVKLFQNKNFIF